MNVAPEDERVAVVINPAAGRGKARGAEDAIRRRLAGRSEVEIVIPSSRADTHAHLASFADQVDRIIVVGGDGTVSAAAQHVASRSPDTILGIVGVGTGNDFATALGLDGDVESAIDRALAPPTAIDALSVGDSWVTTVATFGFSAQVNERAERMSFPRGSSRYTVATLLEVPRMSSVPVEMRLDGVASTHEVMMAAVANTAMFGGGMRIAPDAIHSDGQLDVVLISRVGRTTLLRVLPKAFSGSHVTHKAVTVSTGSVVEFSSEESVRVRGDGESLAELPIRVEVVRGALLVAGANG